MLMGKAINGNVVCSIGLRTTKDGKLFNICVMPLDLNYKPIFGWVFDKFIRVDDPKIKDKDKVFANPHHVVWDQFDLWFDEVIKQGKIIPVVYDWAKTKTLLEKFISQAGLDLQFTDEARDIKAIANYLNDRAEADERQLPFSKTKMRYILNVCDSSLELQYSALQMSMKIAECYKKLVCNTF